MRFGYKISVWVFVFICCFCILGISSSYAETSVEVMDNMHVYQKEDTRIKNTYYSRFINENGKFFLNANIRELKAATRYQVQVRTFQNIYGNKYFSDWTLYKTVYGLKAKKTYHVKIRTYRTVGINTYYSGWSGWKAIKL